MSGRDLHLPRVRHVAARERSPSSSLGSSTGRRGKEHLTSSGRPLPPSALRPENRWMFSSSEESSEHEWDSPNWLSPRERLVFSSFSSECPTGPMTPSSWLSTSSERARARAKAARLKNVQRILELTQIRNESLQNLPSLNSPEDWKRRWKMGLLPASPTLRHPPTPFDGYISPDDDSDDSDAASDNAHTSDPSHRFVKSEGGGSPDEPGFSLPFYVSDPSKNNKAKGKKKTGNSDGFTGRRLFGHDGGEDDF